MTRKVILLGAAFLGMLAVRPARAQDPIVSVKEVSARLGAHPLPREDEIALGGSATMSLVDTAKIKQYGIKGMHEGARVTVTRIAPDRIRIECDEMEPVPAKSAVTLRVANDGTLSPAPAPERPAPKPPL
ncbi:MAG TPA: hypothetical protein VHB25_14095 [Gemmatimonadaceae bacterium]|nr:hypothetical protein [Gemmatimonadaceae bacterium]